MGAEAILHAVKPFDTDERFTICVGPEPVSPLSFRHAIGWMALDHHGREVGMAVTLGSEHDDPAVIARVVREGYEEGIGSYATVLPTTRVD